MSGSRQTSPLRRGVDPVAGASGREVTFNTDEIIVSKTDRQGRITYANDVFARVAGYAMQDLIGAPHSIVRHPDMPRCVFKLLWDTLATGEEVFAYVKNRCKNGDFYWVLAHVTPNFDGAGQIIGYHSSRRVPRKDVVTGVISPLYAQLTTIESASRNAKDGLARSFDTMVSILADKGVTYDEFVLSL